MHGLALVLLSTSCSFCDVALQISQLILSLRDAALQLSDVLSSSSYFLIQPVVFILVLHYLLPEDILLDLQFPLVLVQLVYFPVDVVVAGCQLLDVAKDLIVVQPHPACDLLQSQPLVQQFLVIG